MCDKYGFVYIWLDRKHKRYYVGCHWGSEDDGYICSSTWMKQAYRIRPHDFKRRILKSNIAKRSDMYVEEQRWLKMINPDEIKPVSPKPRYYNLKLDTAPLWHAYDDNIKTIGQKISAAKKGKTTRPCSEETKRKISKANSGKVRTKEANEKNRQAKLGRILSEEHKAKIRLGVHQSLQNGGGNKNVSNETRIKISESQKLRHALNKLNKT